MKANKTLVTSESRYRCLFEATKDGILLVNAETGLIIDLNPFLIDLLGFSQANFIGRELWEIGVFKDIIANKAAFDELLKKGYIRYEDIPLRTIDGRQVDVEFVCNVYEVDQKKIIQCNIRDITARKQAEDKIRQNVIHIERLLALHRMEASTEKQILDYMLDACTQSLQSQFAFIGTMNADETMMTIHAWSKGAMEQCAITEKPAHYPIATAGLWGQVIRQRRPVIVNDYDTSNECKKGYPGGHVPIRRFLSVPVFSADKIVAVAAVANKATAYDEADVGALTSLLHEMWNLIERKRVDTRLQESEEKFRTLVNNVRLGVFRSTSEGNGHFIEVNPAMEKITGYSREELLGMPIKDLYVNPAERTRAIETWAKDSGIRLTMHWQRKDGSRIVVQQSVNIIKDARGNLSFYDAILEDVTERKRAEESLRVNEIKYRTLFELQPTGITVSDAAGNIKESNKTAERLLGLSRETQTQRQIDGHEWKIIRPDGSPMPAGEYASVRVLKENRIIENVEMGIVKGEGVVTWINVTAVPLPLPGYGVIMTYNDITERKLMEKTILESRELFRSFIDSASDGFSLWDKDLRLIENSRAARDRYGYTDKQALIGKRLADIVPFADAAKHIKLLRGVMRTGNPLLIEDAIVNTPQGARHLTIRAFKVGDGLGLIGTDITERLANEQQLAEQALELARANEKRLELERKAQINNRLVSIGEMAAGIAHEINNPLTPILGFADMLLEKDLPEDVKADLQIIRDSARQTADVTKRLLIFARQGKPLHTVCDINEVVASALQIRAYHLKTNNIKVIPELAPKIPPTMADNSQLQQVVLNLIMNAEYSMARGHKGGNLLVKTETGGDIIRLTVKDDGPGISKEHMERLFEPFFTTKPLGEGTGLGLSVCHGIIAEHKGRIYAESEAGKGAAFIVELPIIKPEGKEAEEVRLSESTAPESTKARILVVDDELSIIQVLKRVLTGEGYEVENTAKASEAQTLIKERAYDLILLDIKLPDMSGIELYKHLKKADKSTTRRIIFITGDVMGADTMDFFSRSGAPYITKPFDVELLKREVKNKLFQEGRR